MSYEAGNPVCFDQCRPSGWKGQFRYPRGSMGALVGNLMAFKNAGMNQFAIEMPDIKPDDQVLEIGYAHGKAIRQAADLAREGTVAGTDLSATMHEQAKRLNRDRLRTGRVELSQGGVSSLPTTKADSTRSSPSTISSFGLAPCGTYREC